MISTVARPEPRIGLALGSGSVDGIVGGHVFLSWDRFFLSQSAQYAIRTEGAFEYQYANDLTWQGGPGWFVYLDHDVSVALQGTVSGETKGNDTFEGETPTSSAISPAGTPSGPARTRRRTMASRVGCDSAAKPVRA